MIRLGINGFGRIGRQVLKVILEQYPQSLQVAVINDLADVETNAHLFKYDTSYGIFPGEIQVKKDQFIINGQAIKNVSSGIRSTCPGRKRGSTWSSKEPACLRPDPRPPPTWKRGPKR